MDYILEIQKVSIESKYLKWYVDIVSRAQNRVKSTTLAKARAEAKSLLGYVEGHHIFPRCMCKTGDQKVDFNNYALLTAKEHFICHWLLCKMIVGDDRGKLVFAFSSLRRKGKGQFHTRYRMTSSAYSFIKSNRTVPEETRRNLSIAKRNISEETRHRMSIHQKGKPKSEEIKRKISVTLSGRIESTETRAKKSASAKVRKPMSEETRKKIGLQIETGLMSYLQE